MRPGLVEPVMVGISIVLTGLAQAYLFASETLISLDTATQYFPWYAYLGQSLRGGHIPGWNPATFSGTPFAANPLSGWTYLPAMLIFALLPLAAAIKVYLVVHPLLAAGAAYGLGRVLGLGRTPALVVAVGYANSSFLQAQNARSTPFASVYAWLPLALLATELAVRSGRWRGRLPWWGLAALSMSQILAVWPGQGAYYAAVLVGGYIAYRTLWPSAGEPTCSPLPRIGELIAHGAAVFVLAAALDAAALLPRLEFNGLSNLAGGYIGAEAKVGGLNPREWVLLVIPGYWYAGASVLALAVATLYLRRGRLPGHIGYFGITSLVALLVTGTVETPLHWLLYHTLPGFIQLHPHAPERILTVAYLGPALLAGAGVAALQRRRWSGLVVIVVVADLAIGGAKARSDLMLTDPINGADKLTPVDLETYYQPDAAARFLQQRQAESPGRYIGYAPYQIGKEWPYSTRFKDPATAALEVNNRALTLGLRDAQGYDAIHLQRYDAYLAVLNGRSQNYHDAEVFWAGLNSPLLDLLNVRYLIVAPQNRVDASDAAALARFPRTVYADARVRILENPDALPRAWIVHAATPMAPDQALAAIDSGRVPARATALLEGEPPPLDLPVDLAGDRAEVTLDEPDRIAVTTSSQAAGLLVLSEVYYPAWNAYVDGLPTHLYVADGALRAVRVPAGEHTVELRYESATLVAGSVVSLCGFVLLTVLLLVSLTPLRTSALHSRMA